MKRLLAIIMTAVLTIGLAACSRYDESSSSSSSSQGSGSMSSSVQNMKDDLKNGSDKVMEMFTERKYPDGTYRGAFINPAELDVSFEVKNNKFVSFEFNSIGYKDENGQSNQYQELADYLVGKEVWDLKPLYKPNEIIKDFDKSNVDSGKLISAINDGLNRGVYMLYNDKKSPAEKVDNSENMSSSEEISSSNSSENN